MGRMKDLYISLKEANQGCIPDSLDMKDFAEMHKLKIYNKEHYESWKNQNSKNLQGGASEKKKSN
jgi:hypothetical protein